MNVASVDLCKELFELSGWNNDGSEYRGGSSECWPDGLLRYDLGYLLRKLPYRTCIERLPFYYVAWIYESGSGESEDYDDEYDTHAQHANTPDDAVCKLAIELFKQGILTKGGK